MTLWSYPVDIHLIKKNKHLGEGHPQQKVEKLAYKEIVVLGLTDQIVTEQNDHDQSTA